MFSEQGTTPRVGTRQDDEEAAQSARLEPAEEAAG